MGMKFKFDKCNFESIKELYIRSRENYISPVDTFHENKILNSNHYKIYLNEDLIGYTSVHCGSIMVTFDIFDKYKKVGQEAFYAAKKIEYLSEALVPTSDEYFLGLSMDNFKAIDKQAYFFKYANKRIVENKLNIEYRLATKSDIDLINDNCDKDEYFFDDKLEKQIEMKEVYIGFDSDNVAAFGILERSKIIPKIASIGMYTNKKYRNRGVGKTTLYSMVQECEKEGIEPISGCWYFNHNSKKTLESIGFVGTTRYLKVTFN